MALVGAFAAVGADVKRPNIVILYADDMGGGILAHHTIRADLERRVNDAPFVMHHVVKAECEPGEGPNSRKKRKTTKKSIQI